MTTEETLEPNWEATVLWFAEAFKYQSFDVGARDPIVSFMEQVRYLDRTNPEALERVLEKLRAAGDSKPKASWGE